MKVAWFSCGATSAVAAFYEKDARILYIETGSHHPDSLRFLNDCERWYGRSIETLQNTKYKNHFDCIEKTRFINGPRGARCTSELKKKVRLNFEKEHQDLTYVWGFEYAPLEIKRANQIKASLPQFNHIFPLIDRKITKQHAISILEVEGIKVPEMYRLGFHNNNCIGCPKGGAAYWNKIRVLFPDVFDRMAKLERDIGRSCLKLKFLDKLDPSEGRDKEPLVMDCGHIGEGCEIQQSILYFGRE